MAESEDDFDSKRLLSIIKRLPQARTFWVGYSGGADSTALLHALFKVRDRLPAPLKAIHFHHGLHPDADSWSTHCREFCEHRAIPFRHQSLDIRAHTKSNYEETARNLRYKAVSALLGREEIYLTAHHADDQAETLFLNLMRGSGIEGLAGIPELRTLGEGWVARPLLNWNRSELVAYLERMGLEWKQDPTNENDSYDRNFLRNRVFPLMEERWPGLSGRLNRSARIARVTSETLAHFIGSAAGDLMENPNRMPLHPLLALKLTMQALVIRQWLRLREVPAPPEVRLLEFLNQLSVAARESGAEICWRDWRIKHYQHELWLQDISADMICPARDWTGGTSLNLGSGLGQLQLRGDSPDIPPGWQVHHRRAGKRIRLNPLACRQTLKECFRAAGIPPWLRKSIPVLYWDGEPVAIGDWALADSMISWLRANRVEYVWRPVDPLLIDIRNSAVGDG